MADDMSKNVKYVHVQSQSNVYYSQKLKTLRSGFSIMSIHTCIEFKKMPASVLVAGGLGVGRGGTLYGEDTAGQNMDFN